MNESISPPQPKRGTSLMNLISMVTNPRRTFTELSEGGRRQWLTPLLVLTLTTILAIIVGGYLKSHVITAGPVELPPDWEFWTPEMQENYLQGQQSTQGPLFTYILPLIGAMFRLWLGWLAFSGILHLMSTLLGGRGTMQSALNVVAWAAVPFIARDLLRIVFMLIAGHAIASPGLSGFASDSSFLASLLTRADIFLVWNIALIAIGFIVFDGLQNAKAFAGVGVIVAVVLLIEAALASWTSSLSLAAGGFPLI